MKPLLPRFASAVLFPLVFALPVTAATVMFNPVADTFLDGGDDGSPNSNFGSSTTLEVTRFSIFVARPSLLRFDLSSIPAGATVESATLELFSASAPSSFDSLFINRITSDWNELTVTFNSQPGSTFTEVSDVSVSPFNPDPVFDVLSVVQGWVDGTHENYGFHIENGGANFASTYRSRENMDGGSLLTVTFIPEPSTVTLGFLAAGAGLFVALKRSRR